jgi:hypothetical protein
MPSDLMDARSQSADRHRSPAGGASVPPEAEKVPISSKPQKLDSSKVSFEKSSAISAAATAIHRYS